MARTGPPTASGIHTWISTDKPQMDDFNGVINEVDTALASHPHDASDIMTGTLSPASGGTGQTSLLAARNAMGLGNTTGPLPIENGGTGAADAATARENLGLGAAQKWATTISTTWSGTGPYTQSVTVTGLLETDTPVIGPVLSATTATARNQLGAWSAVSKIMAGADSITVTCLNAKPTTAIPIQIMVVR